MTLEGMNRNEEANECFEKAKKLDNTLTDTLISKTVTEETPKKTEED